NSRRFNPKRLSTFRIFKEQDKELASPFETTAEHSMNVQPWFHAASPGIWWSQSGSNRRPPACKAGALPAELWPHELVGLGRFELPTSPLSGVRSNQLSYRPEVFRTGLWPFRCNQVTCVGARSRGLRRLTLKGGDPAAPS